MARIYKSPAPSANKAARPVVETKAPKAAKEPTAAAPAVKTDEQKGKTEKKDGE